MSDHGSRGWEATENGWRCTECHQEIVGQIDVHDDDAHICSAVPATTDRITEAAFKAAAETMCAIHMRPDEPPMAVPNDRDPRNRVAACYRCQKQARAALTVAYPLLVADAQTDAWEQGAEWAGAIPLDGSCGSPGQNPYRKVSE